jgi:hypothetical protein
MIISPFWAVLAPALGGGMLSLLKEDQRKQRNILAVLVAAVTFLIVPFLPPCCGCLQRFTPPVTWTMNATSVVFSPFIF